jgi:hypothetical protein
MDADTTLAFPSGRRARAVRVRDERDLGAALAAFGLERDRPALVLVGGADDLPDAQGLGPLFAEVVALAERLGASVVDGGTDAGIMRLAGEAHAAARATFPLVGVAAEATVVLPRAAPEDGDAPLEPNHTHFVFVPGSEWGDEVPWLGRVAAALAGRAPSATLLVDGGDVALRDVEASLQAGRAVVVVAGSGRAADEFATGAAAGAMPASAPVTVLAPAAVPGEVARLLEGGAS